MSKLRLKNAPLPRPLVRHFAEEAEYRHAYLCSHPFAPRIHGGVAHPLFGSDGFSFMGDANVNILQRFDEAHFLVEPRFAVWQASSQAVFVALFHLTAGASACAELPAGVYAFGGSVAACLAIPIFVDRVTRIDYSSLHMAGKAIGRFLSAARMWRRSLGPELAGRLPEPLADKIESFLGFEKASLAAAVASILKIHGVFVDDKYDREQSGFGRDGNWSWWLSDGGHAPYARTDVDYYITAVSLEEAGIKAEALRLELKEVLGEHVAVRTPNTLTLCPPFPGRHVQIVLTAHLDLASVMLFADLDSTAAGYDGRSVWGCGRFLRAVRGGVNVVPPKMWAERVDTIGRAAKYVRRGFGVSLCREDGLSCMRWDEYDEDDVKELRHAVRFSPPFFTASSTDTAEVSFQLESNTAYNEYKIPRGPGVTPDIVQLFFRRHGAERRILESEKPLHCEWRLSRRPEEWVQWGTVAAAGL